MKFREVNKLSKFLYKKTEDQISALNLAVLQGNVEIVRLILKHENTDVNLQRPFTALTKAIELKNKLIVKLLLDHPKSRHKQHGYQRN